MAELTETESGTTATSDCCAPETDEVLALARENQRNAGRSQLIHDRFRPRGRSG